MFLVSLQQKSFFSPIMKIRSLLLSLTAGLLLVNGPAQAQSIRTTLTWKDFTPSTIDSIGMASHLEVAVSQALTRKEGKTYQDRYFLEVHPDESLYDPSKVTDWDLRYNQVLFDMALLSMKQALQDNHKGQVGIYQVYARYRQIYDATKADFITSSISGRDTAVISSYEDSLKVQVAALKSEDFYSIPFFLTGSGAVPVPFSTEHTYNSSKSIAFILGYENDSYLTGLSEYFSSFNGINISAEIRIKPQFRVEAQYAVLWSNVKKPDFYFDLKNNYNWQEKTAQAGIFRLGAGFYVLSRDRISLIPFGGLQVTRFSQNTGIRDQTQHKITSTITDGGGAYLGMDIDYRPKGTWGFRFKVFGSHESFDRTEATWSLNSGFTITF